MKRASIKFHKNSKAGFTLVELMVSIGIMILVTAIVLVNYGKFNTDIVLSDLAYDVGLSVRNAQTYGVSVKGYNSNFSYPYGIHFSTTDTQHYIIFVDTNDNGNGTFGNHIYDGSAEKVQSYTIQPAYSLKSLCINNGTDQCGTYQGFGAFDSIDISFVRPNPDATITIYNSTNPSVKQTVNAAAEMKFVSSKDTSTTKMVIVRSTGQISVQ